MQLKRKQTRKFTRSKNNDNVVPSLGRFNKDSTNET